MTALFRPAKKGDLEDFMMLGASAGPGITSITHDSIVLEKRLALSETAFTSDPIQAEESHYLFALEIEGIVVGMSGIASRIATKRPFYAYHIHHSEHRCETLHVRKTIDSLHFIQARKKPTEIGSLYLSKEKRGKHLGKLLSFGRFLFMASFPIRFDSTIIAEMRGVSDAEGRSPFWEAIGRPFFGISFKEADDMRTQHPECIKDLFPKHPIYPLLLPKEAQECIGVTHPNTLPARKILEKEGFKTSEYIDIFDGGPHLYAKKESVHSFKESKVAKVAEIKETIAESAEGILCNGRLDFRAVYAPVQLFSRESACISSEVADALEISTGDSIRYALY